VAPDVPADAAHSVAFTGSGPNRERQASPHAHQAVVDAARGRLLVSDLGADRLRVIGLDGLPASLPHDDADDIVIHAGAGPRHLVIEGDLAVVANELDRTGEHRRPRRGSRDRLVPSRRADRSTWARPLRDPVDPIGHGARGRP
jgi:hypothetical protein